MYKKCEICGLKSFRKDGTKRIFLSKFPTNEERCKKWVKFTGNEDLVHLPIEKLHALKHLCGNHFRPKDFNRKHTRLKKTAVPSLNLTAKPLDDQLLIDFPCHLASATEIETTLLPFAEVEKMILSQSHNDGQRTSGTEISTVIENAADDDSRVDNVEHCAKDAKSSEADVNASSEQFSWNKECEIVPEADTDLDDGTKNLDETCETQMYEEYLEESDVECVDTVKEIKTEESDQNREHKGFKCDCCRNVIVGFRYTCLQCSDLDLCRECESRGKHPLHYMLRVPEPRPFAEVQSIVHSIRRHLFQNDILLEPATGMISENIEDGIKIEEVKEELEEGDPFGSVTEEMSVEQDPQLSISQVSSPSAPQQSNNEPTSIQLKKITSNLKTNSILKSNLCNDDTNSKKVIQLKRKPQVVLSRMPLKRSSCLQATESKDIAGKSTGALNKGDGTLMFTPKQVRLNKVEIEQLLHSRLKVKTSNKILIRIDDPDARKRLLELTKQKSVKATYDR